MNRTIKAAFALGLLAAVPAPASAGVYADELARCLVRVTTAGDQDTMILWSFAGLSLHPTVKAHVTFTEEQRAAYARQAVEMFQRMLLADCHAESVNALRHEGPAAIGPAFQTMGNAGARSLSANPAVSEYMRSIINYLDRPKLEALFREVMEGSTVAPPPPPMP